jgi:hypothetical protein
MKVHHLGNVNIVLSTLKEHKVNFEAKNLNFID